MREPATMELVVGAGGDVLGGLIPQPIPGGEGLVGAIRDVNVPPHRRDTSNRIHAH